MFYHDKQQTTRGEVISEEKIFKEESLKKSNTDISQSIYQINSNVTEMLNFKFESINSNVHRLILKKKKSSFFLR